MQGQRKVVAGLRSRTVWSSSHALGQGQEKVLVTLPQSLAGTSEPRGLAHRLLYLVLIHNLLPKRLPRLMGALPLHPWHSTNEASSEL